MNARLETVVSVRDVARAAGWDYQRMLRHLQAQDRAVNGMLLMKRGHGKGARYSLTLAALEQLHPQWFSRVTSLTSRVEELEVKVAELEGLLVEAHRWIGEQRGAQALRGHGPKAA